jgi:hypothetical protein
MPLRHVLLRTGAIASSLTPESVDSNSEQTRVLECLFYFDIIENYEVAEVSRCIGYSFPMYYSQPAKASCSGVPAWFATSNRPFCCMGLWYR